MNKTKIGCSFCLKVACLNVTCRIQFTILALQKNLHLVFAIFIFEIKVEIVQKKQKIDPICKLSGFMWPLPEDIS